MASSTESWQWGHADQPGDFRAGPVVGHFPGIGPIAMKDGMALQKQRERFGFLVGERRARGYGADQSFAHERRGGKRLR